MIYLLDEGFIKKIFQNLNDLKDDEVKLFFTLIDTGLINQTNLLGELKDIFRDDSWDESKVSRTVRDLKNKGLIGDYNKHPQKKLCIPGFNNLYEQIIEKCQERLNIIKQNKDDFITRWEVALDQKEIEIMQEIPNLHFIEADLRNLYPIDFIGFFGREEVYDAIIHFISAKEREKIKKIEDNLFSVLIARGINKKHFVYEFEINPHRNFKNIVGVRYESPARFKHFYTYYFEKKL